MTETKTDDGLVKISDGPTSISTTPTELAVPEVVKILELHSTLLMAISGQLGDVKSILYEISRLHFKREIIREPK